MRGGPFGGGPSQLRQETTTMAASKREADTGKPTQKLKCKEMNIVLEYGPGEVGVTVPNPPATGKWHLISIDGVVSWEPHE